MHTTGNPTTRTTNPDFEQRTIYLHDELVSVAETDTDEAVRSAVDELNDDEVRELLAMMTRTVVLLQVEVAR